MTIKDKSYYDYAIILIVIALIIILSVLFLRKYRMFHDTFWPQWFQSRTFLGWVKPLSDPEMISGWMTFSYINIVYKLPPDYLQHNLSLSWSKFPNISIDSYAKARKLSKDELLKKVKSSVKDFFQQNNLPK